MERLLKLVGIVLMSPLLASAEPLQDVALKDGSSLRAEVISLHDGTYTLRSPTLGEVQIPATQIRSIGSSESATQSTTGAGAQFDEIRKSFINDPQAMDKIHSLKNDPMVHNILNDEATMRAISAGDISALMNDPKIKALMNHATIKELTGGAAR